MDNQPLQRRDSDSGVVRFETSNTSVFREEYGGYVTLLWESRRAPGDSIRLLEPAVASADPTQEIGMLLVSPTGHSEYRGGREKVVQELDEAAQAPEIVATVRVECVIQGIGSVALAYQRSSPGGGSRSEGAMSVTAKTLNHGCLKSIFKESAMPALVGRYEDLIEAAAHQPEIQAS